MAVEIDVKLKSRLPLGELMHGVSDTLSEWFGTTTPQIVAGGADELFANGAIAQLDIEGIAHVSILSSSAGSEQLLGEEGGLWATFSAGEFRTPESLFLASVAAAVAARIAHGHLVDEAALVGPGRELTHEDFTSRLKALTGGARNVRSAAVAAFGTVFGEMSSAR